MTSTDPWGSDPDRTTRHYACPTVTPTNLANSCHRYVETSDMRENETLREWRGRTARERAALLLINRKETV